MLTWDDIRYTTRRLAGSPGFALAAITILGVGLAGVAAMFSIVNALLFLPLSAERAGGQLIGIYSRDRNTPDRFRGFSYDDFVDLREQSRSTLPHLFAQTFALVGLGESVDVRRAFASVVSANFFEALDASPVMGRGFTPEEENPLAPSRVAVISHGYWRSHGANPAVIGTTVRINGQPFAIVGVAPRGFGGTLAIMSPELWLPLGVYDLVVNDFEREGARAKIREHRGLTLAARIPRAMALEALDASLERWSTALAETYPAGNRDQQLVAASLMRLGVSNRPNTEADVGATGALLVGLAAVVLLVACLNLANLMLSRGVARRREIAIRLAVGGSRARVLGLLFVESLALSLAGGVVGLALSWAGVRALIASFTVITPVSLTLEPWPDGRVVLATLLACGLSAVAFGAAPAWKLTRGDVVDDLRRQVGDLSGRRGWRAYSGRRVLVAGQLALSLALVTVAGLFVRSAARASRADAGIDADRLLLVGLDPSLAGYDTPRGQALYRAVLERIRTLPGVETASLASIVPLGEFTETKPVRAADAPGSQAPSSTGDRTIYTIVGADYFRALGLPLLRGREFTAAEERDDIDRRVAIVDAPLADRLFGGADPLGRAIRVEPRDPQGSTEVLEVVGVAPPVRHELFEGSPAPHVYVPFGSHYRNGMTVHVRTSAPGGDPALLAALRREILAADPGTPILSLKTFAVHRDASFEVWGARTAASLITVFGVVALLLATFGVYSVKAFLTARRTRELGIRSALGASRSQNLALLLRDGASTATLGLAVGLVLAVVVARLLSSLLYGVAAFDPATFAAAVAALMVATLAAAYFPARRATKINPVTALRDE